MSNIDRKFLIYGLKMILAPVARYCLRHSLKFQDFLEFSKSIFIQVAKEELEKNFQEITHSRLSVMTGMHRRDVMKYSVGAPETDRSKSLISKVVGQWRTNKRYVNKKGQPRVLNLGLNSEFTELVATVSQDLNPATVLFELERLGSVVRVEGGVKLQVETYVPKGDVLAGFNILGADAEDLTSAVEENLFGSPSLPHLHLRTEFDRVRTDVAEKVRLWLLKEGQAFHGKVRDYVSKYDQDVNPDPKYSGGFMKVVLGAFSKVSGGGK